MIEQADKRADRTTGARELSLRQLVDFANDKVKEVFDKYGEHQPIWMIALGDEVHVMPTPFTGPQEKKAVAFAMRSAFKEFGVKRFVFIVEAWTYGIEATKVVDLSKLRAPSDHPERKECIMISGEDVSGEAISIMRMIIREPGKKPRLADPVADDQGSMLHGVFHNMLGRPEPKHS